MCSTAGSSLRLCQGISPECPGESQVRGREWFGVSAKDGLACLTKGSFVLLQPIPHPPSPVLPSPCQRDSHGTEVQGRPLFMYFINFINLFTLFIYLFIAVIAGPVGTSLTR